MYGAVTPKWFRTVLTPIKQTLSTFFQRFETLKGIKIALLVWVDFAYWWRCIRKGLPCSLRSRLVHFDAMSFIFRLLHFKHMLKYLISLNKEHLYYSGPMRGLELIMWPQWQWKALKKTASHGTNRQTDMQKLHTRGHNDSKTESHKVVTCSTHLSKFYRSRKFAQFIPIEKFERRDDSKLHSYIDFGWPITTKKK